MPLGPVLSETDRKEIRKRLQGLCEHRWINYGYKKTSIKELCTSAGISIGTFYTLYPTKEDLFFETIKNIQKKLINKFLDICKKTPTKEGFAEALKELYREYDRKPFLYNINTPDFQSFASKLSNEAMEELKLYSLDFSRKAFQAANLNLKIEESKAYGVFSALLSTINTKETLSATCDYFSVFDFMVDQLIPTIFE